MFVVVLFYGKNFFIRKKNFLIFFSRVPLQQSSASLHCTSLVAPLLKPNLKSLHAFCHYPTFYISLPYTYFYGTVGFFISVRHLKRHLGKMVVNNNNALTSQDALILHDLKIIAASMGIVQYICLLVGCLTQNPALFLPHMTANLITVFAKILNVLLTLSKINIKSIALFRQKTATIAIMMFNWCQEFCVFRQYLCICDL
ncbi:unnamed protein product [Parnassius mnemosyne]|uniref:Vomeronasal type-1 receptor n=1 Tax=Parnassius mnemosyne TaxID=213953 RepID=A0AAV1LL48_9NEOP